MAEYKQRRPPPAYSDLITDQEELIQAKRSVWDQAIADFDDETDEQVAAQHEQYQKEMENFHVEWETTIMDKYRRPSAALIRQRTLEADRIQRDQIALARYIHEGIRVLEEKEYRKALEEYEKNFIAARDSLIASQNQRFKQFSLQRDHEREMLLLQIAREEAVLVNRLNVLQQKPPPGAPWRTQCSPEPPTTRPKVVCSDGGNPPGRKLPLLRLGARSRNSQPQRPFTIRKSARDSSGEDDGDDESPTEQESMSSYDGSPVAHNDSRGSHSRRTSHDPHHGRRTK
jgi:hypothetical protein